MGIVLKKKEKHVVVRESRTRLRASVEIDVLPTCGTLDFYPSQWPEARFALLVIRYG